jgi:hypothetical protein
MVKQLSAKVKAFPELFCEECITDPDIECERDVDVICAHCGAKLCGYHMKKHLEEKELVSCEWTGVHRV